MWMFKVDKARDRDLNELFTLIFATNGLRP